MKSGLFAAALVLYAIASIVYLTLLGRGTDGLRKIAATILTAALGAHVAFIASQWDGFSGQGFAGFHHWLSLMAFGMSLVFLLSARRQAIAMLGAFVVPLALMLLLASGLGRSYAPVSDGVQSAMLSTHIATNVGGLVSFSLAFAAALAYVVQERLLRRRQLGGVFRRLPALDILDTLGLRAALIGFPLLSIGMVTGTIWILRAENPASAALPQVFAVIAWAIFGAVLLLRVSAGWRGRRAAVGTIMGFACAIGVLIGYLIRGSSGAF